MLSRYSWIWRHHVLCQTTNPCKKRRLWNDKAVSKESVCSRIAPCFSTVLKTQLYGIKLIENWDKANFVTKEKIEISQWVFIKQRSRSTENRGREVNRWHQEQRDGHWNKMETNKCTKVMRKLTIDLLLASVIRKMILIFKFLIVSILLFYFWGNNKM